MRLEMQCGCEIFAVDRAVLAEKVAKSAGMVGAKDELKLGKKIWAGVRGWSLSYSRNRGLWIREGGVRLQSLGFSSRYGSFTFASNVSSSGRLVHMTTGEIYPADG